MPKLLIQPFGESVALAWSLNAEILKSTASDVADKPIALENAYRELGPEEPDEIVLENGPGNFTSLRVALGFARGLALGYEVPSRGIGTFLVDYSLLTNPPDNATLYRDARGGRFYQACFASGELQGIALVNAVEPEGYSAEILKGALPIESDADLRLTALTKLADTSAGQSPAIANYVRPPDAALPSEPPLVILDDRC